MLRPEQTSEPLLDARSASREDFSDYVAHLQLHMALQARKLVPPSKPQGNQREVLQYQTQAICEKLASRQYF